MPDSDRKKGLFITLEGGEGSGKTSQINRLSEFLVSEGHRIITTREPGGTYEGEAVRDLLVQREGGNWSAMAEVLLLFAARLMHIEKVIKPALENGKIVICDRFTDSTFAYQGYGRGLDVEKIKSLKQLSIGEFDPDITFILDIDVSVGLERSNKRLAANQGTDKTEDRFERMDIEFHEKLRHGFLDIAKNDPNRCYVIDASQDMDNVFADIKKVITTKI